MTLNFYESLDGTVSVEITDVLGQILIIKNFNIEKGYNDRIIDVSKLAKGIYYLKAIDAHTNPGEVGRQIKFLKY